MSSRGSVTTTGLKEMRAAAARFSADQTAALRKVARDTAIRVQRRARQLVPRDTGVTAAMIQVEPKPEWKQYRVYVWEAPRHLQRGSRTAFLQNLNIWLEYGTKASTKAMSRTQAARPYMRPAANAEEARYRADMAAAAEKAARETFK
ncbi:MAG: hypothetical protein AB7J63_15845 [Vicinamibacterales bacterium]